MILLPRIILLHRRFMGVSNIKTEISQYYQVIYLLYNAYRYCLQIKEQSIINPLEVEALFDVFTVLCLEKMEVSGCCSVKCAF